MDCCSLFEALASSSNIFCRNLQIKGFKARLGRISEYGGKPQPISSLNQTKVWFRFNASTLKIYIKDEDGGREEKREEDDKCAMIVLHENKYVDAKMYNVATNTLRCMPHYQSLCKWTSHI